MPSDYELTPEEIKEGIKFCYQHIQLLLDATETVLNRNNRYISSGLYTHAVEELGKLLLLQKELNKSPTGKIISVNPTIFGKSGGGHTTMKFEEFMKESSIPEACKKLRYVKGAIYTGGFRVFFGEVSTDFLLRLNIFYVDRKNGTWLRHPDIEISDLRRAIEELRKWMVTNITIF